MECVSSSDDLTQREFNIGDLLYFTSPTSEVSCSELPFCIPHLVIEKIYMDNIELSYMKKEISKGPAISGVLHMCDTDRLMVSVGRINKLESRQILQKDQLTQNGTPLGKYYCIWNTTPVNINTTQQLSNILWYFYLKTNL